MVTREASVSQQPKNAGLLRAALTALNPVWAGAHDFDLKVEIEFKSSPIALPAKKTGEVSPTGQVFALPSNDGYFTCMPGCAPESGLSKKISLPPGPAAITIPSETPKRILRGARLATMMVSRPSSSLGSG